MRETDYYREIESWFKTEHGCQTTQHTFKFHGINLFEGDVVGWSETERPDGADIACELKAFPLPIGSSGYGSIGQALMLQRFARQVYVGCVAEGGPGWRAVLEQANVQKLIDRLQLAPARDFAGYLRVARDVFQSLFRSHGLGLLVIDDRAEAGEINIVVLVRPASRPEVEPAHGCP